MSLEERVAALEKGFVAIQQDVLLYRTETTSTNTLGILNKVIATQELRYREISENETMLLGMFTSVQKDIRTLQEDVSSIKDRLDQHTALLTQILARLPEKQN
jgi:hypothetical protein